MAVITAYGHLGTLQNLSGASSTSLPRMMMLFFLPGATLTKFIADYLKAIVLYLRVRWMSKEKIGSLKYYVMVAAGLHVSHQKRDCPDQVHPAIEIVSIDRVRPKDIKHTMTPWTWDSFLLRFSRVLNLLVVLAQAVASLVLIIRRYQIKDAILLLDMTNGLYAIVGILCACNSLLLMVVGGTWTISQNASGEDLLRRKAPLSFIKDQLVFALLPMFHWRGDHLVNYRPMETELTWSPEALRRVNLDTPALPTTFLFGLVLIATSLLSTKNLVDSVYPKSGKNEWKWRQGVDFLSYLLSTLGIALILVLHLIYWITLAYELAVIVNGHEMAFWGVDSWRWSDPWSDILFVY
ncbi:hypothetical protein MMC16_007551 [Acarospora aff. strigata]|nr:hypothetical protein [Acarospora aff. strigata]